MININKINKVYNFKKHNEFQALSDISLHIYDGSMNAIIGKSGSGKSTLLHIIGLLDDFSSGEYMFRKQNVIKMSEAAKSKLRAKEIGFVKQDFALIEEYSVLDNVMLPLYPIKSSQKKKKVLQALDKLGISNLAYKEVRTLSGGEKQRTAIARAIINAPSIILADEPTGALDSKTAAEIMNVFKDLHSEGKTIIIVTHDFNIANQCERIIEISDGRIISDK